MNPKQLGILVGICAVLGVIGVMVTNKDKATTKAQVERAGQKVLEDLDVNAVAALVVNDGETTCTVKKIDGLWRVSEASGYNANYEMVRGLMTKLMDLKTAQIVQVGESDYGRLELNEPGKDDGGLKVTLLGEGDKELASLLLGKDHLRKGPANSPFGGGYPDGRYVTAPGSGIVALVSETFSDVDVDPNRWIDKAFVKVEKIRSGEARGKDGSLWKVARATEAGDLKLEGEVKETHEVDSSKMTGIDSTLRYPNFSKIGGKTDAKDWGFDGDEARAFVAETFDGVTWTVKIGKVNEDKEYPVELKVAYEPLPLAAGPEGESDEDKAARQKAHEENVAGIEKDVEAAKARFGGWVYLVASFTVDDLLYSRDDLLKEKGKKEEAKPPIPGGGQPPIPFLPPGQ